MLLAANRTGPLLGVLVVFVCFLLGQLPPSVIGLAIAGGGATRMTFVLQAVFTVGFACTLGLLALWVRYREGRRFATVGFPGGLRPGAAGSQVARGAAVAAAMIALLVLVNVASGAATLSAPAWGSLVPVLILLAGFAVQGSTEEVLTRGFLVQAVAWRWGVWAAIVVQAMVFAFLHGANGDVSLFAVANLLIVAVMLGFWALAERGLWGVCAFHAVWNWGLANVAGGTVSNIEVTTSLTRFSPAEGANDLLTGGGFGLEGSAVATALLGIGAVVALVAWRRRASSGTADGRPAA